MKPWLLWIVLAFALGASPAIGGEWIRFSTPQFELYSRSSEAQSRELMTALAGAQSFVSTLSFVRLTPERAKRIPVRIIALSSKEEYAPFQLSRTAFGYFRHSQYCDYIVLRDIRPEHRQAAIHEYMHLVFRQAGLMLPLWFNEGLADFYSSLEKEKGRTRIGQSLPSRTRVLETLARVPLATLIAVNSRSPYYMDSDKISIFYAESWGLVHMLAMSPGYQSGFTRLIASLANGFSSAAALSQVYGKSMSEIESDLFAYLPLISYSSAIERPDASVTSAVPVAPLLLQNGVLTEALREEVLATSQ